MTQVNDCCNIVEWSKKEDELFCKIIENEVYTL